MIDLKQYPRAYRARLELLIVQAKYNVAQGSTPLTEFERLVGRRDSLLKSDISAAAEDSRVIKQFLQNLSVKDLQATPVESEGLAYRLRVLEGSDKAPLALLKSVWGTLRFGRVALNQA